MQYPTVEGPASVHSTAGFGHPNGHAVSGCRGPSVCALDGWVRRNAEHPNGDAVPGRRGPSVCALDGRVRKWTRGRPATVGFGELRSTAGGRRTARGSEEMRERRGTFIDNHALPLPRPPLHFPAPHELHGRSNEGQCARVRTRWRVSGQVVRVAWRRERRTGADRWIKRCRRPRVAAAGACMFGESTRM